MDNVILLGDKCFPFREHFEKIPQYKVFTISCGELDAANHYQLPVLDAEKYENPSIAGKIKKKFDKQMGSDVLLITSAESSAFLSLCLLEKLKKNRKISVLYLKPASYSASQSQKTQDKVLWSVFQEYARSGVFERCILIDNQKIIESIEDVPISEYKQAFYKTIISCITFFNKSIFTEPLLEEGGEVPVAARILSFGFCDYETWKEKNHFVLNDVDVRVYSVWVTEEEVRKLSLLKDIKNKVFERKSQGNQAVDYKIFQQKNDTRNYLFYTDYSSVVQKYEK